VSVVAPNTSIKLVLVLTVLASFVIVMISINGEGQWKLEMMIQLSKLDKH
jgi:hypothetical protein